MTATLENLISQLGSYQPYKPLTDQEIRTQASQRYQSEYDQKRLSAQQAWENDDAALARELSGLQKSYDAQRASSAAQTRNTYSQADRHALSRGMQRSSFSEATLANIDLAGNQAMREIDEAQTAHEKEISEKRTERSMQLSQTLKQLDSDQRSDELAYADALAAREYDRGVNSQNTYRDFAMQIYEYQHELEQEAAEQARWRAEFNAKYGSGGGDGRSGSASRKNSAGSTSTASTPSFQALVKKPGEIRKNQREMTK